MDFAVGASPYSLPARNKNYSRINPAATSVEQQRAEIIEAFQHVSDEWILKAVARLHGSDAPIPECHRRILDSRLDMPCTAEKPAPFRWRMH